MDKNLYFDHSYTPDKNHRFLKKLKKLGFTLKDEVREHPGGLICRFIMFPAQNPSKRNYLEFIHTKPNHKAKTTPGFSFGYNKGLEKLHKKMKASGKIQTQFVHRNYNWQEDRRGRNPGWNFVTFKNTGIRGLFPWITEYEVPAGFDPKKRKPVKPHPNKVNKIIGFEFELNPAGEKFFKIMCGRKNEEALNFGKGVKLYFSKGRRTKLKNVVLQSANLKSFLRKAKVDAEIKFHGKPAALIKNPNPNMWDIIIL